MDGKKIVSVVVVNYRGLKTIYSCVKSIIHSQGVGEILVIDNYSNDGSIKLIERIFDKRLRIIKLNSNIGLCKARNLGAAIARGEYLAFVDQDSLVHQNWLEDSIKLLDCSMEIGAVQCMNLSQKNSNNISYAGIGLDGVILQDVPLKILHYIKFPRPILFPIGAGFVIKREAWERVKGFDDSFFIGNDDIDLGIRIWLAGYQVICTSKGIVYHDVCGGNLRFYKETAKIFSFYGIKNILTVWVKDLSSKELLKYVLPFSLMVPLLALLEGGPWGLLAIGSFLKELPLILKKRIEIKSSQKIPCQNIILGLQQILPLRILIRESISIIKFFEKKIIREMPK